jgi:hypothetical protein
MAVEEFDDICHEMVSMHKAMKNAMEMIFATSPLLALQTGGWHRRTHHGTHLLRVSDLLLLLPFIED